jgi:hypothetical protein
MAAHWPHTDEPGADLMNDATKCVASTTLEEVEWENSKLIEGDVARGSSSPVGECWRAA